jgi:hypothetical protein
MISINPYLLITLNVNDLNSPTKKTELKKNHKTKQYSAYKKLS